MGSIAVTGASGTVGSAVLAELSGHAVSVRALSRRGTAGVGESATAAGRRDGSGQPEWVRFSFTQPSTWTAAFDGVGSLFVVRPPQIADVAHDLLPALVAARAAGLGRVVFLSVLGAQRNPLLPHRRVERWLETSGMAATCLRAGNFMQNLATVHAADIRDRDQLVVPAGDATMSYVDARDVAALAAACLTGTAPTRGSWDVTGPAAVTHTDVAAALSRALGRQIIYTRPGLPRYWAHARRTGMPAATTAVTSVLYTLARGGIGARLGDDFSEVLGRPPRDLDTFAHDYRTVWARRPVQSSAGASPAATGG